MRRNIKNPMAKKHKEVKNVTGYNRNRKSYYVNEYLESKKPKN